MAVELRNALAQAIGMTLPTTLLFDYPTIGSLADHLIDLLVPDAQDVPPAEVPSADEPAAGSDDLDGLSDEEAEALLLEELSNLKKK
jgi:hypothetical protein